MEKRIYKMGGTYSGSPDQHKLIQTDQAGNLQVLFTTAAIASIQHNTLGISALGNAAIPALGTYGCIIHSVVYEEKGAATPEITMVDAGGVNYTGAVECAASKSSSILGSYAASAGGSGAVAAAPAVQLSLTNGAVGDEWHLGMEFW